VKGALNVKIWIPTILSTILILSLSACGNSSEVSIKKNSSQPDTSSKTENSPKTNHLSRTEQPKSYNNNSYTKGAHPSNTETNSSSENNGSEEAFYGHWQIKKVIAYAPVGTYSSDDIHALTGKQLTLAKDKATCFGDKIADMHNTVTYPVYKKTVISKNDLLSSYRVTHNQLGLNDDSITKVEATGTNGFHTIFFFTPDKNRLILYGGGTFFQLDKVLEQNNYISAKEGIKNQSTIQETKQNKAVSLVKDYIRDKNELIEDKNHFVLFDGVMNNYYIVRYSTLISGHSSTNGRYAVDINTGKIVDISVNPSIISK